MTEKQHKRYWGMWGDVRKILTTLGEFSAKDADEQRKLIQQSAVGVVKSSKDLTQKELDKVYDAFESYLVLVKGPAAPDAISQPCKRLIWRIEQLGIEESYLAGIATQQFKTSSWRTLEERHLELFSFSCAAYASGKRRAAK